MKLGIAVNRMRCEGQYLKGEDGPIREAWLDAMGFVWDGRERRWEDILSALAQYKQLHGDLLVPRAFVVPAMAPWAREAWGMKLGNVVSDDQSKKQSKKHHAKRFECGKGQSRSACHARSNCACSARKSVAQC